MSFLLLYLNKINMNEQNQNLSETFYAKVELKMRRFINQVIFCFSGMEKVLSKGLGKEEGRSFLFALFYRGIFQSNKRINKKVYSTTALDKSKVTFSVLSNVIMCNQIMYLPWRMSGKNEKQRKSFESSFRQKPQNNLHMKVAEC